MGTQKAFSNSTLFNGLPPQKVLFCIIDIGKNVHTFSFLTASGQTICPPTKTLTNLQGFNSFSSSLQKAIRQTSPDLVIFAYEASGIYHLPWQDALFARFLDHFNSQAHPTFQIRLLQPSQVKASRQARSPRKRKTDPIDIHAMSDLLAKNLGNPITPPSTTSLLLQQSVANLRYYTQQLASLSISILRTIDRLWPGALINIPRFQRAHPELSPPEPLVRSKPLQRQTLRLLIRHCPNPYHIRQLGPLGIRELFHSHNLRCGPKRANHIYQLAINSLLPPEPLAESLASFLQTQFRLYLEVEQAIALTEQTLAQIIPSSPAKHLLTMPGISTVLAARYLALVGFPLRFETPQQAWALAGMDQEVYITGDKVYLGPITRRGNPYHRDTLFKMGFQVALHCPAIGLTYVNALKRGKGEVGATIHTANRVHRIAFALLRKQEDFRPPPISPAKARYVKEQMRRRKAHRSQKVKARQG